MPADFLLELGSEELPASFIVPSLEQLKDGIVKGLAEARLKHGAVKVYGTPRRLAVVIEAIADVGEDVTKQVQGPSVKAGFKDGVAQTPAIKFAESVGRKPEQLDKVSTPKGEYLAATVEEKGKRAAEVLPPVLHQTVHALRFAKSMRWGDVDLSWGRPLHWIVALLGSEVLPVVYSDVKSGRTTFGHRFLSPAAIELKAPGEYLSKLEKANVIADLTQRKAMVVERLREVAKKAGGALLEDEALVDQVVNLIELPCPVRGTFDPQYLDLPPEVLIQEMKSHQRYFAVVDANGKLMPTFIAVSNTPVKDEAESLKGYQRVLRSRLSDGRHFFTRDRAHSLESRIPRLADVNWQKELGSYAQKVSRLKAVAAQLCEETNKPDLKATVERAADLCKADLVTEMVGEFPELQGVMGREYALASGEKPEVAKAIFEHYLPRNAADELPTTDAGALLGIADRLDTLVGIFGIGQEPTGAKDPFALRRAALGVINLVLARGLRFSLDAALHAAAAQYSAQVQKRDFNPAKVREFFQGRLKSQWSETSRPDVVEAVLTVRFGDLVQMRKRLSALDGLVKGTDFNPLAVTFKRVANIVAKQAKDVTEGPVDPTLLKDAAEKTLHAELAQVKTDAEQAFLRDDFEGGLKRLTTLKPHVDTFFDQVMVMADDPKLKENRVRMLQSISELFRQVGDFAQIQAE